MGLGFGDVDIQALQFGEIYIWSKRNGEKENVVSFLLIFSDAKSLKPFPCRRIAALFLLDDYWKYEEIFCKQQSLPLSLFLPTQLIDRNIDNRFVLFTQKDPNGERNQTETSFESSERRREAMTDNNFHLPRMKHKQHPDNLQELDQSDEQPNPTIVLNYQTSDDQIIEDHLIEEYEEEVDEGSILSEVIETDEQTVTLTTVDSDTPSTIHKPALKKYLTPSMAVFKNNNNTINKSSPSTNLQYQSFIGRLVSKDNILLISQNIIEIGRNSSKAAVDFHVGKNSFVSRKHLILHYDGHEFNLVCASKNGVFIDDQFVRKSNEPTRLPSS